VHGNPCATLLGKTHLNFRDMVRVSAVAAAGHMLQALSEREGRALASALLISDHLMDVDGILPFLCILGIYLHECLNIWSLFHFIS